MSGLNPFRPKKLEGEASLPPLPTCLRAAYKTTADRLTLPDHTAYKHQPHLSPLIKSSSTASHPVSLSPSSTAAVAAGQTDRSSLTADAPLSTANAPGLNNTVTSDPFSQNSDVSDDDAGRGQRLEEPAISSPGALYSQETIRADTRQLLTTPTDLARGQTLSTATSRLESRNVEEFLEDTAVSSSIAFSRSSVSMEETDSENAAEKRQSYALPKTSGRPISISTGINPKALAIRSGNKDRVPPPPPKSHHGKLISSVPRMAPSMLQTMPSKATNGISFHSSSSFAGLPVPPRIRQEPLEHFGTPSSQPAPPTDALRRSQSQHKRPPTPPLSRRHSQMRRSKSTLSKPSSFQLSTRHSTIEVLASTSSSPGSRPLTPSVRTRDSRNDSSTHDEESSSFTLQSENLPPTSYLHTTEVSGLQIQSSSQGTSRRASSMSHLPTPPPPRRTRAGNHGSDNDSRSSLRSEHNASQAENLVSHPSNAKDILADLSRLQKEVDDLRGHYENQRTR
ncbi:uncharacterized protein DSM5745_02767 [Aspergillus mulundensis]|uniref:Uncharacterized protein n=1 Tax=Aspergillus mulundensis TaxID=1810919 RepID=A0A3D8SIG0_9EURO|nr:hypothetical protein DSM5745_02767 [Aspergillus mulundensis]RDW86125.1 hypothetical protein DSM5745_02767 [Aspergillus mulundensis]